MLTSSSPTHPTGVSSLGHAARPSGPSYPPSARPLAALLLAAIVSALVVAADGLVDSYADGHLLLAWSILWAVAFAAMALFAGSAREAARRLLNAIGTWKVRREARHADAAFWALAQRDARIMADLQGAMALARDAQCEKELAHGRAWVEHHPIGTLNAAYTGPRRMFRTTPLTGLPTHLQCYPG